VPVWKGRNVPNVSPSAYNPRSAAAATAGALQTALERARGGVAGRLLALPSGSPAALEIASDRP